MRVCHRCTNRYPDHFELCPVDGEALTQDRPSVTDPLIGTLLLDRYRVQELLGKGAMGRVYLAVHDRIGRKFAVKVMSASRAGKSDAVERFFREACAAAELRHPGIVQVTDYGETAEGVPVMVMELLDGEDVEKVLNREGMMDIARVIRIAGQAADALDAVHAEGIIHRDIKPGNLFLTGAGSSDERLKVLDFGIARLSDRDTLTKSKEVMGTPFYMAPEQARGAGNVDSRSDIYSLGATLYHMLCGRPPFVADSFFALMVQLLTDTDAPPRPRQLRPEIPGPLDELLLRMIEKDRSKRLQAAGEMRDFLARATRQLHAVALAETVSVVPAVLEEVRVVTVLVMDIEVRDGEGVEAQTFETTAAYEVLASEVQGQGGTVDHLVGNRAVGLFGLVRSFGDEPVRAVRAAHATRGRLGMDARIRIAVGTGRTLVTSHGVSTGPAAAAAARLLGHVDPGQIVVDAATFGRIRGVFQGSPIPASRDEEPAFEVTENIEQTGLRAEGRVLRPDVPTIGRDVEMEQLWGVFRRTLDERQVSTVTITGDRGVGKTRLKTDLVLRIDALQDIKVYYLEGAGQVATRDQPFSALGDMIRRRARLEADCLATDALARLRELVARVGVERDAGEVGDLLAVAAGVKVQDIPLLATLHDEPRRLRERVIDAFVRLIGAMAETQPVVLCMDDAHDLDHASIDALAGVCASKPTHGVLLVVVGQPEMPGRVGSSITAPGGTLELGLAPLSQPETGCLLAGLLGSEPPPDLWTEVWRRTEGVPLFIEEIFFSLRQQGALLPDLASGGWRLADETDLSSVPVTVQGMIQARLDGLEPELRRVIHRAAVLGAVFWDKALVALDVADPDPLLAMLASRDVIVTRHTSSIGGCHEYAFRSTMVRDTAYEAIPRRTRSTLHSRAADWLAGRAAAPSVLAAHLEAAGRALEAAWQHVAAGDLARGSYANEEALRHYEIAMDLAARALSWRTVEWAEAARAQLAALFGSELVLTRLGRLDDGLGALDSIVDISTRLNDRRSAARAQVRRGVLTRQRDPRAAVRMLVLARLECQAVGDVEWECDALVQLAQALASAGDLDQAASTALEAVVVARRIGSGHTLLRALMIDATVTTTRGDHWNAIRRFDDALDVARSSHDAEREAYILQSRGFLMSETGDLEAAERDLDAALFLCERTGNRRVLAYTLHNLGWVLWKLGRVDEARSVESRALEVSRDIHLALVELEAEVYLAVFDVGESRPRRALERTQHVIDVSAGYAEPSIHAGMVMALALLDLGRDEEAAGAAARAITAYADLGGTQQFEVELHLVAATCFERAGRPRDAADARERASAILDRRIAALADPVAGEKFRASVGAGLPWRNAP